MITPLGTVVVRFADIQSWASRDHPVPADWAAIRADFEVNGNGAVLLTAPDGSGFMPLEAAVTLVNGAWRADTAKLTEHGVLWWEFESPKRINALYANHRNPYELLLWANLTRRH
jgi:hypothetical protein